MEKLSSGAEAYHAEKLNNIRQCAEFHGVKYTSLYVGIMKRAGEFKGTGRSSQVLTDQEEKRLNAYVLYQAEIGESWKTLQTILQQVLLENKKADAERMSGFEELGQCPNISWVQRFAARNKISLPRTSSPGSRMLVLT